MNSEKQLKRIPVLVGPTAVGKSDLAFEMAQEFNWDIISCDSRQIYRSMDIGTAKASVEQLKRVQHWLVNIIDPLEAYSVHQFCEDAIERLDYLKSKGRTGLICGGTGLYLRGLAEGIGPQQESDPVMRKDLMDRAQVEGGNNLHAELNNVDPDSAKKIHKNDIQRIVRALLVFYQTGTPLSVLQRESKRKSEFEFVVVKMQMDREILYNRINKRVDDMIMLGLYDEFRMLLNNGYTEQSPGMQCVGYREFFGLERGEYSFDHAVELIKQNTRRFAKRQITWFAHQQAGMQFDVTEDCVQLRKQIKKYFLDNTTE